MGAPVLRRHPYPVAPNPAEFSIWTREAGAGGLSIAVEGPSKAEIAFEDRKDGSCGVSYVVQEPGRCSQLGLGGLPQLPSSVLGFYLLTSPKMPGAVGLPSTVPAPLHPLRAEL